MGYNDFLFNPHGPGARFARRRGARRHFHDRLICATAFFSLPTDLPFSRLTFLEAVEDGWWYAAKLPEERLAVAFASDVEILKAVGDAAATYDPISSQGVYKALADALRAAPLMAAHLTGEGDGLEGYEQAIFEEFEGYLANRNYFYGLEGRRPESGFWSRRRQAVLPVIV